MYMYTGISYLSGHWFLKKSIMHPAHQPLSIKDFKILVYLKVQYFKAEHDKT